MSSIPAPKLGAVAIKAAVEKHTDALVDQVLLKLTDLIPGTIDNVIVEAAKPKIKEEIKALLIAKADLISDKV